MTTAPFRSPWPGGLGWFQLGLALGPTVVVAAGLGLVLHRVDRLEAQLVELTRPQAHATMPEPGRPPEPAFSPETLGWLVDAVDASIAQRLGETRPDRDCDATSAPRGAVDPEQQHRARQDAQAIVDEVLAQGELDHDLWAELDAVGRDLDREEIGAILAQLAVASDEGLIPAPVPGIAD